MPQATKNGEAANDFARFLIKVNQLGFYDYVVLGNQEKDGVLYLGPKLIRTLTFDYESIKISFKYFSNNLINLFLYDKHSKIFINNMRCSPNIMFHGDNNASSYDISFNYSILDENFEIKEEVSEIRTGMDQVLRQSYVDSSKSTAPRFIMKGLKNLVIDNHDKVEDTKQRKRESVLGRFFTR